MTCKTAVSEQRAVIACSCKCRGRDDIVISEAEQQRDENRSPGEAYKTDKPRGYEKPKRPFLALHGQRKLSHGLPPLGGGCLLMKGIRSAEIYLKLWLLLIQIQG